MISLMIIAFLIIWSDLFYLDDIMIIIKRLPIKIMI